MGQLNSLLNSLEAGLVDQLTKTQQLHQPELNNKPLLKNTNNLAVTAVTRLATS